MKVLQICNKPPFPPLDGGAIGMNNITQGLIKAGHQVKVLAVETPKHPANKHQLPKDYLLKTQAEFVFINTNVKPVKAFFNLFTSRSYHITRFQSPALQNKIKEILTSETFDIIQIESIFLAPLIHTIRPLTSSPVILRAPNVEHQIWETLSKQEKFFLKKIYLKILANRLKKEEKYWPVLYDGLFCVTQQDKDFFLQSGTTIPMEVIPTGMDIQKISLPPLSKKSPVLFHIGAMDWLPNLEGMDWFLQHCWPLLQKNFPEIQLILAGRNMPERYISMNIKGVKVLGEVENASEVFAAGNIMIVPLHSGSGMRVKIVEAMMLKKPVVTTSKGAEGLQCESGKHIFIADSPEEFIKSISILIENQEIQTQMIENAYQHASNLFDNELLTQKLLKFFEYLSQKN